MLYQEYVPDEQRAAIEQGSNGRMLPSKQVRSETVFAVFHIRENGEDIISGDHFRTPMQAACRYRLYDRGELSANRNSPPPLSKQIPSASKSSTKPARISIRTNASPRSSSLIWTKQCQHCDSSNACWRYTCPFSVAAAQHSVRLP